MQTLLTIFIVIIMWAAIWELFDLVLDNATKNMSKKDETITRVVVYLVIIALGMVYAKYAGIKFV